MTRSGADVQFHPMNRRSFLHVAAGALAAPLVATQASAGTVGVENAVPQCPVGFVASAETSTPPTADGMPLQRRVVPAEQLRHGDRRLAARGVRMQFEGIRLPEGRLADRLRELKLDLSMEVPHCDTDSIPWHLWSYSNSGVLSASGGVDAFVPLRNDGSLVFDMNVQWAGGPMRVYQAKLTTGGTRGVPKLQAGTYCITVPDGERGFPSAWQSTRWHDSGDPARDGLYLPVRPETQSTCKVPVPFAHLVFTIDRGSPEALVNA